MNSLNTILEFPADRLAEMRAGRSNTLFEVLPRSKVVLPWRPLGSYPTPVVEMPAPTSGVRLFVKRDDLTSPIYGGNKLRKLEFLLAEATLDGRTDLITMGGLGSNHALATAVHGRAVGLGAELLLYDQPVNEHVRRNLSGFVAAGARLHYVGSTTKAFLRARSLFGELHGDGRRPYFVNVGGTSRLGCFGYVNAALELAEQVRGGELPEPDYLFVALGTTGTAAGLLAGLRIAGLRTHLMAVRVADPVAANRTVLRFFAQDTLDHLVRAGALTDPVRLTGNEFTVLTDSFGGGYGHPTDEGNQAIEQFPQLALETTYTGKALAACLRKCTAGGLRGTILFWNTFNSAPVAGAEDFLDRLPLEIRTRLHREERR